MDEMNLQNYALGFYGYGNLASKLWFIGPEEGGGGMRHEVEIRLSSWHSNPQEILHAPDFIKKIPDAPWFGVGAKLQPTWRKLMITACAAGYASRHGPVNASIPSDSVLMQVQQTWGAINGPTLISELQPFPSPKMRVWNYKEWFPEIRFMQSRSACLKRFSEERVNRIRKLIADNKPRHVVFYGVGQYLQYWYQIAGQQLQSVPKLYRAQHACIKNVHYWICLHPANRLLNKTQCDEYFQDLGSHIAKTKK